MVSDKITSPLRQLPLSVSLQPGAALTKEQAALQGKIAADEVVILEIHKPMPGQHVQVPHSMSGVTGQQLTSVELFRAWALWALDLQSRDELPKEFRLLAQFVQGAINGPLNEQLTRELESLKR